MAVEDAWEYPDGRRRERYGVGLRWRARWRENGRSRSRSFRTKKAAETFLIQRHNQPQAPADHTTVGDLLTVWLRAKKGLQPGTVETARWAKRAVNARWGTTPIGDVRASDVRVWLAELEMSNAARRNLLVCLKGALALAVEDGRLPRHPLVGVRGPRPAKREPVYMSAAELRELAEATGRYAPLVMLMGTTGLRIGEAIGLTVGDVDAKRGRLRVRPEVSKADRGRDVPVPASVLALLDLDRPRTAPLFVGDKGGHIALNWWRTTVFREAAKKVGREGMTPHELRHTAASLAIGAGADVLMVQRMLGHRSASVTLGIYAHLFDRGLDDVAARMDSLLCHQEPADAG